MTKVKVLSYLPQKAEGHKLFRSHCIKVSVIASNNELYFDRHVSQNTKGVVESIYFLDKISVLIFLLTNGVHIAAENQGWVNLSAEKCLLLDKFKEELLYLFNCQFLSDYIKI